MTDLALSWLRRKPVTTTHVAPFETVPAETTARDVAQTIDRLQYLTSRLTAEVEKYEQTEGGRDA